MKRVLVLRPEPGASATLERARGEKLEAVAMPLFEIEPVAWTAPEPSGFDALLLTSANAVRCGGAGLQALRGLPVHAVGKATAEAARHAGFDVASTGDSGVDRLLGSIEPELRLLHLCGEDHAAPAEAKQKITSVVVYRARETAAPDGLGDAQGCIVLVHSPRAGRRFAQLIGQGRIDKGGISLAAISDKAAEAAGSGWAEVGIAERPDDEALLALAARLCNKTSGE